MFNGENFQLTINFILTYSCHEKTLFIFKLLKKAIPIVFSTIGFKLI